MLFFGLILIQIIVFIALIFILRHLLTRNVAGATLHLKQLGEDYAKKEANAKKLLEEADQYYKDTRLKAKKEVDQLKAQFEKEIHEAKDKTLKQARAKSEEVLERANKAKQAILAEVDERISKEAVKKACELVEDVLSGQFKPEVHSGWVDDLIENGFKEVKKLHIKDNITQAKVVSALPLDKKQHDKLSEKLKTIFKKKVTIKEEVDPKVIAGIIITIGSLVLDGSLRGKIREKITHAK